jgi:uncharacterized protein
LPNNFLLAYSPYAPQGPSVLNSLAWERWKSFQQPQRISQPVDSLLLEQNLIMPVDATWCMQQSVNETLTAWLHVTNACNLDCSYCYVRKSSEFMDEKTGVDTIGKIFSTAQHRNFKSVKIKYAGGEATLQFPLIKKLAAYAKFYLLKANWD